MRLGITGHRNFDDALALTWVENAMREKLRDCLPIHGFTSLAKGADQIFARVVIEFGGKLEAIIPFPGYGDQFDDPEESVGYRDLIGKCSTMINLPFLGSRDKSYLAAGQYVADHCELLIAVWDGQPAAGIGGTADVVKYALSKGRAIYQINPLNRMAADIVQENS